MTNESNARTMRALVCAALAFVACRAAPTAETTPNLRSESTAGSAAPPAAAPAAPAAPRPSEPVPELRYVEIMTGGAGRDDVAPLVIALHGLGDRPEHFVHVFDGFPAAARVVAPHSNTPYSDGYSWFDFRPSDPDFSAPGIARAATTLAAFANAMSRRRPTVGKPIVVGFSQGGALSFALAALHPEAVGAAFPMSGWFPALLWPAQKPDRAPPIVAFHGTADHVVPIERMRPGASRLASLGYSIDVREFDGVGHAVPEPVRAAMFGALSEACEHERRAR